MTTLADRLRQHVERLAAVPRPPGTPAHKKARAYIRDHLTVAGFTVQEKSGAEDGFEWINVFSDPLPAQSDLPIFIIAAHYDSTPITPGADDNASGVAALLELAHWIRPRLTGTQPVQARLQLVAYDLEESGLIGSWKHASDLFKAKTPLAGMISLEMLGYCDERPGSQRLPPILKGLYPDVANFIGVVGNERAAALLQRVVEAMQRVPQLPVEAMTVPGDGRTLAETRLSDHSSFWDHGYPALMLTDTSFFRNPHYHQPSDTPQTLHYPFLAKVTEGVCLAVEETLRQGSA
jgi:Zn-dependent M28 family amino/carboxypeptidase